MLISRDTPTGCLYFGLSRVKRQLLFIRKVDDNAPLDDSQGQAHVDKSSAGNHK
jgi:hypothetical protein